MSKMRKYILIITFVLGLTFFNFLVIRGTHTWYETVKLENLDRVKATVENEDVIEVTGIKYKEIKNMPYDMLIIHLRAKEKGQTSIRLEVSDPDNPVIESTFNVNSLGIITENNRIGSISNVMIIRVEIIIIFIIMIINIICEMSRLSREAHYSYKLMFYSGVLVFLVINTIIWMWNLIFLKYYANTQLYRLYSDILTSFRVFAIVVFPLVLLLAIILVISNLVLIHHEGSQLTNMLGIAVGGFFVISTLTTLGAYVLVGSVIDIYNYKGIHIEYGIESVIDVVISYLECMMIGSAIWTRRAALNVPAFNKDYIIILGCKIRKDGTVTPLLQGRADRAIWFANRQLEETGREIKFVASGGQGGDEIISEAEAIKNYLVEYGIPEDKIIVENRSTTTHENLKFSYQLIMEDYEKNENICKTEAVEQAEIEKNEPGIVFSTTGYHVFRSGHIADSLGIKATGIGSRTKWYFYINALIREFVANMNIERNKHINNVIAIILIIVVMLACSYKFNIM